MPALAYDSVLANIKAKVRERYGERGSRRHEDLGHKALYDAVRIEKTQWSVKWNNKHRFSFEEIGRLADHFDAPPGWPYTTWEIADANRRAQELLARLGPELLARFPTGASPPGVTANPPSAAPSGHTERRRRGGRK